MDVFKKGVAVSTWQCAPDDGLSNWSQWAKSKWPFQWLGMKRVKDSIDDTPDFWNRYAYCSLSQSNPWCQCTGTSLSYGMITQVQRGHRQCEEVGLQLIQTILRLASLLLLQPVLLGFSDVYAHALYSEWARLEPRQGHIDEEAVKR